MLGVFGYNVFPVQSHCKFLEAPSHFLNKKIIDNNKDNKSVFGVLAATIKEFL